MGHRHSLHFKKNFLVFSGDWIKRESRSGSREISFQVILIGHSPGKRGWWQVQVGDSGGKVWWAVFWRRKFQDMLMAWHYSVSVCVCMCTCRGKDTIKNDSQVSVGTIYSNREQWVGGFGWSGDQWMRIWESQEQFSVVVSLKELRNTVNKEAVVHMRLKIWRQIYEFGNHQQTCFKSYGMNEIL